MGTEKLARYLDGAEAAEALRRLGGESGVTEFAQVRNLDYVFAPTELYPLAPRVRPPLERIAAFAVDMDGTSTTTEPLALHALEYMVRRFTGRLTKAEWPGLDEHLDYPYVIGNSNFRHTEFLIQRYRPQLDHAALTQAFIEAVCWTLTNMTDAQRRRDVTQNARNCGLADLLADAELQRLVGGQSSALPAAVNAGNVGRQVAPLVTKYGPAFRPAHDAELVAAALDVYYMRYHSILRELEAGQGERLARELLGPGGRHLVEPMPAYEIFVPLVKGWLGPEADALYEPLRDYLLDEGPRDQGIERSRPGTAGTRHRHTRAELDSWRPRLGRLAKHFARNPAKLALVTASIAYETHACMKEVVHLMAQRVQGWPVPTECRLRLAERLADCRAVFDGFVCASDVWEARLKPHRDLYSLALFQMSVPKADYRYCVGLEDTEPGIISLRAAGVGCAIALPNRDTSRQDYSAAAEVIRGGLPELILARNLFLQEA
jgi:beta-phosphoglucomutase-like phosphatase (HAD superfamily)